MSDNTTDSQYWIFDQDCPTFKKGCFVMGHFHRRKEDYLIQEKKDKT